MFLISWLYLLIALLTACTDAPARTGSAESPDSPVVATDDAGREVRLSQPARRIVSLLPATTETLVALGAGDRLVARTDYDNAPELQHLPSVGGGLDPSLEALLAHRPDLVIAWEAAGGTPLRHRLETLGIPVFGVRTQDTTDVLANVRRLGQLTGRDRAADALAARIRAGLDSVRVSVEGRPRPTVFYAVNLDPPMDAGPNTFIAQLIEVAGGRLAFSDAGTDSRRLSPQLSLEEIIRRQPEVVILPVEGNPEAALAALRGPGWRELEAVQCGRVALVDAELLNRPGPRIAEAARALRDAIEPHRSGACRR